MPSSISIIVFFFFLLSFTFSIFAQSTSPLQNNQILSSNVTSGGQQHFYFSTLTTNTKRALSYFAETNKDLQKRAPATPIYLTLTSCSQPIPPPDYQGDIPSLDLYLSTVNRNTLPGPTNNQNNNTVDDTKPGRISWQGDQLSEIWIGVVAPTLTTGWTGQWTYELAVSTNQWMHPFIEQNISMTLEDTDNTHALFLTNAQQPQTRLNTTLLITQNVPNELKYSYCAIKSYQPAGYTVNLTDTRRGLSDQQQQLTRQQMMISNLTQGQIYAAYIVEQQPSPNPAVSIYSITYPLTVQTKSNANCRLIYNLDFCDDVAYSVPTDPTQDLWNITRSYDRQAKELFAPFGTALSQFNCNSTQYSLVRNCDDCYRDYKRWLCAVTIPRCTVTTDSSPASASLPSSTTVASALPTVATRNVTNGSSRNPWIDSTYKPGEWTELLPCIDLCYFVVQSCPPFLQFNCPEGDLAAQQYGYWKTQTNESVGPLFGVNHPTCNRLSANVSLLVVSSGTRFSFNGPLLALGLVFVFLAF